MKLWKVSYKFEVPGEHMHDYMTERYLVVADSDLEARKKAEDYFTQTRGYIDLNLSRPGLVECIVNEVREKKIKFPRLKLKEDREAFIIKARVSDDGKNLEFIVVEKS